MVGQLKAFSLTFSKDTRGAVAILFGLMSFVFFMAAGVAIDYGRIIHMNKRLTHAADSAALAAAGALLDGRLDNDEIEVLAKNYFDRNMEQAGGSFGTYSDPDITVDRAAGNIAVASTATVPMTLTGLAGINEVKFPVNVAARFDQRDIDLGLALDVTGSMRGSKIDDLKQAATDLIDILLPDSGRANRVRIGLAPYAGSVNAGPFAAAVTNYPGGHTCVHERAGTERFTDASPTGLHKLGRAVTMSCPSVSVEPMTDDKALLKRRIDSYTASGWTAGHLGAAWAWYLISPNWSAIWPADSAPFAYGRANTTKAVVLMTDGEFNTEYEPLNGTSDSQARSVCAEMKSKGVDVYSVAFQAPRSARRLLQRCSSGSSFYFQAENGEELRQAFKEIAKSLNNVRLTN